MWSWPSTILHKTLSIPFNWMDLFTPKTLLPASDHPYCYRWVIDQDRKVTWSCLVRDVTCNNCIDSRGIDFVNVRLSWSWNIYLNVRWYIHIFNYSLVVNSYFVYLYIFLYFTFIKYVFNFYFDSWNIF